MKKIFIAFAVTLCIDSTAQQAITNSGSLKVHTGANLSFFGNYTNTSTANLVNNGNIYIKKDVLSQQPAMNAGSGTLYINGSVLQTISGTEAFKTYNLTTDNASSILLNSDLVVSSVHTFTNGLITTASAPAYLVYEAGSSYTGSNDSRHVNGWVKKVGTTDFIFPVGNLSFQRTIRVHNLSANSVFSVKYKRTTPDTANLLSPVTRVSPEEYWQVNNSSGTSAMLTLNWDNSKVPFPNWSPDAVLVANYDGSFWRSKGDTAIGNPATTGTITSDPVSTFGRFTFGLTHTALPVKLVSFDARKQNGNVSLSWISADEMDIAQYVVERSDDYRNFFVVGKQLARNSGKMESYSLTDFAEIFKTAYYRLRMIEKSGKETLSQVKQISTNQQEGQVILVNNPVINQLVLLAKNDIQQQFSYTIHQVNGQQVQQGSIRLSENNRTVLPLQQDVTKGAYIITLRGVTKSYTIKFIVQ